MFVCPALRGWIADPERRAASRAVITDFARDWRADTPLPAFVTAIEALPDAALADAVAALLADAGWVEALVARMVATARADRFFEPPLPAIHSDVQTGLKLLDHPRVAIALGVGAIDRLAAKKAAPAGPRSIAFSGFASVIRVIASGGAIFSFWDQAPPADDFAIERASPCRFVGRRAIADGELLRIDGRRTSYVVERADASLVLLHATIRVGAAPLMVEYDAASHACIAASSTDEASSRTLLLASLIRQMGRTDAAPALLALIREAPFYARWQLMRELIALDLGVALPALRAMAGDDPNPDLRAAAAATLAYLDARAEERSCRA